MVTPERYINHDFDRLEAFIRLSGKTDQVADLIGDLQMIFLDRRADDSRLISRAVKILEGRTPSTLQTEYVPTSYEEMISMIEEYSELLKRFE